MSLNRESPIFRSISLIFNGFDPYLPGLFLVRMAVIFSPIFSPMCALYIVNPIPSLFLVHTRVSV